MTVAFVATDNSGSALTDQELEMVANDLYHDLFRAGVLMGVGLAWLKDIVNDPRRENFGKCMDVLLEWRKNVLDHEERLCWTLHHFISVKIINYLMPPRV